MWQQLTEKSLGMESLKLSGVETWDKKRQPHGCAIYHRIFGKNFKGIQLSLFPTKGNGHGRVTVPEGARLSGLIWGWCVSNVYWDLCSFRSCYHKVNMDGWILFVLFRDRPQINLLDNLRVSVPVTCRHPFPVTGDSNSQALAPVDIGHKCLYNRPIRQ